MKLLLHNPNRILKCVAWLFLFIMPAILVWNYHYGYSPTQIKHILLGEFIYDAEQGEFTYFGEVYFPREILDTKFFEAAKASYVLSEYGEPVLYKYRPAENEVVFRFCAFGYMQHSRVYRIHINEMEKSGYVIYNGDTRIDLDAQQCDAILSVFSNESFWNQPFNDILIYPELTIMMEGKRGKEYHVIKRYPPRDNEDTIDNDDYDNWFHTGLVEFESIIDEMP